MRVRGGEQGREMDPRQTGQTGHKGGTGRGGIQKRSRGRGVMHTQGRRRRRGVEYTQVSSTLLVEWFCSKLHFSFLCDEVHNEALSIR